MRVLFHADLSHGQAAVVWRCRHLLEGQGIDLVQGYVTPPESVADVFEEDTLHLVHSPYWHDDFSTCNRPVVVLERIDGPQLSASVRKNIGHPNLKAVIKNTVTDLARYNSIYWRSHEAACRGRESPGELLPESKRITLEQYEKLRLGFSFLAYPHYDALRDITAASWPETRPYDLHFAGTCDYGPELLWLNEHRLNAHAAIARSPRPQILAANRAFQFKEYYETMRKSRFVVSPWGLGEPCYRDFEAILCGCMVVKPDTSYVKTVPGEFYKSPHFSRCVCKPDFSDLDEVVERAQELSIGDKVTWANWILQQNSTEAIAGRLAKIFREAVS